MADTTIPPDDASRKPGPELDDWLSPTNAVASR
jgi:hypothetical protein